MHIFVDFRSEFFDFETTGAWRKSEESPQLLARPCALVLAAAWRLVLLLKLQLMPIPSKESEQPNERHNTPPIHTAVIAPPLYRDIISPPGPTSTDAITSMVTIALPMSNIVCLSTATSLNTSRNLLAPPPILSTATTFKSASYRVRDGDPMAPAS